MQEDNRRVLNVNFRVNAEELALLEKAKAKTHGSLRYTLLLLVREYIDAQGKGVIDNGAR